MAYICPYVLSDLERGRGLKTGEYLGGTEGVKPVDGLFIGAGCTVAFVVKLFFAS